MVTLRLVLLILAFLLFAISAAGISAQRINLLAAGLAIWVLATLVG